MEDKKIYGFYGRHAYDMVIYLAAILNNLKNKVLIIDDSMNQEVLSCFLDAESGQDFFQYKDVDYVSGWNDKKIETESYDFLLFYKDHYTKDETLFTEVFVITDQEKENLKNAGKVMERFDGNVHLVIRDACNQKLDKVYMSRVMERNVEFLSYHEVELDYYDYSYRILMQHEYYQDFRNISRTFKKCLLEISDRIARPTKKSLDQAYRLAERGKSFGSSFLE